MKRLLIALALSSGLIAANRDWQQGKLIDVQLNPLMVTEGGLGITNTRSVDRWDYTIETSTGMRYIAQQANKLMPIHPIKIDVGSGIRYVISNESLYVIDEGGKEYKLKIVKYGTKADGTKN